MYMLHAVNTALNYRLNDFVDVTTNRPIGHLDVDVHYYRIVVLCI